MGRAMHLIKVKEYMTFPASDSFKFMAEMNNNIPMPSVRAYCYIEKETKGLVYVKAQSAYPPYAKWNGWVIKSAIELDKVFSEKEKEELFRGERTRVIIYIGKNKNGSHIARLSLSKKDEMLVEYLKDCFGAKPDKDLWKISIDDVNDIVKELRPAHDVRIVNPEKYNRFDEYRYEAPKAREKFCTIPFKTKPFPHQLEAYNYGMTYDRILIADDPGLGKSLESICIALGKKKQFGLKHCLVICGVNSLKWNWVNEIEEHSDEKGYVLGQRKKRDGSFRVEGNATKLKDLQNIKEIEEFFIIINAEAFQNKDITAILRKHCESSEIGMIIVDEFHRMKNTECKQGANLNTVKTKYQVALTGTPILNSPLDLYAIFSWLGYEKKSFYAFKSFYTRNTGNHTFRYRNTNIMRENLQKIMLRRRKEDVLNLPEKVYHEVLLEMPKKQQDIYTEVLEATLKEIDLILAAKNPLSKLIRLRQATAHTAMLSSTIAESVKMERLRQMVEDLTADGKKVLVYSNWTEVTDIAKGVLADFEPLEITGDVQNEKRMGIVKEFQTNPEKKVLIGTIKALGTGLTITATEAIIFLDDPWTNADKEQAIDRAHRIGQNKTVFVYTLICKNTIDERVRNIVKSKKDISEWLVDKKENVQTMVKYLLGLADEF